MTKTDMVNSPPHYTFSKYEVICVIEEWDLPFHLANVVKYISRAGKKGNPIEDLEKAYWYLNRYINWKHKKGFSINLSNDHKFYIRNVLQEWKLETELSDIIFNIYNCYFITALNDLKFYIERMKSTN